MVSLSDIWISDSLVKGIAFSQYAQHSKEDILRSCTFPCLCFDPVNFLEMFVKNVLAPNTNQLYER
jgi:hypothetical protein